MVLGVTWRKEEDVLTFQINKVERVIFTRRGLLSKIAGMFDPLGLASPATIKGKIGLQKLTIIHADWDETIEEQEQIRWIRWLEKLEELKELKILRCIRPVTGEDVESEVHVFCDASEEAFAAVAYLRSVRKEKHLFSNIIMAKTRVAPKKTISVAKFELQAALLGARMAKVLVKELTIPIRRRRFWTDSSCVRNWLRTTALHYKPFVSHRIGEIQTLTESGEWRFVPGTQYPADWVTRSTLTGDLMISPDWIEGPKIFQIGGRGTAKRPTLDEGEYGDQSSK